MTKPLDHQNRGISTRLLDQPYLLLILAPLFWGGNVVAAKLVVGEIDPFLLLAARCVGATLFILPFSWRYLKADWPVIRSTWLLLMAYGFVGYALFNVRPKSNQSLDGKRMVRVRLAGTHRPMLLGLATYKPAKRSRLAGVFMARCRSYISDQYIPGMSAASFFDPHIQSPAQPQTHPRTQDLE